MKRTALAALLFVLGTLLTSADAKAGHGLSNGTYQVKTGYEKVIHWIESNRDRYYKAANAEILETRGPDLYLVRSSSPLGSSTYVVRETRTDLENGASFHIQMVERVSGRVRKMKSVVTITDHHGNAEVATLTEIDFQHLLASDARVKSLTDKSISRTKRLVLSNIR